MSRLSKEERDFCDTKNAAAEFCRVNRVPQEMERALNELFLHQPEDIHGYLVGTHERTAAPEVMLMLATFLQYPQQQLVSWLLC